MPLKLCSILGYIGETVCCVCAAESVKSAFKHEKVQIGLIFKLQIAPIPIAPPPHVKHLNRCSESVIPVLYADDNFQHKFPLLNG